MHVPMVIEIIEVWAGFYLLSIKRRNCHVQLSIHNLLGQEIETLVNEYQLAEEYHIIWNTKGLPSGIYFCQLESNEKILHARMFLIK